MGGRQQEGVGEWKGLESPKVRGDWEIDEKNKNKKKMVVYWITKTKQRSLNISFLCDSTKYLRNKVNEYYISAVDL